MRILARNLKNLMCIFRALVLFAGCSSPSRRTADALDAAARALVQNTDLDPPSVVRKALEIAAQICVYTNDQIRVETLP